MEAVLRSGSPLTMHCQEDWHFAICSLHPVQGQMTLKTSTLYRTMCTFISLYEMKSPKVQNNPVTMSTLFQDTFPSFFRFGGGFDEYGIKGRLV